MVSWNTSPGHQQKFDQIFQINLKLFIIISGIGEIPYSTETMAS